MKIAAIGLLILGLVACSPAPPATPKPDASDHHIPDEQMAPLGFLLDLYKHYNGKDRAFSPLGAHAVEYFDTDMLALMLEDARLSRGEVGALDGDPVCDCQDYGKLRPNLRVETVTATTARVTAHISEDDRAVEPKSNVARQFTYDLVKVGGNWRIHDIASPSTPSLRALFIKSNQERMAATSNANKGK